PVVYRLVVKKHPGMKGERPLGYYDEFKKLYNVELLSPSVDGHDLIRGAAAIATITGTTAFEAALYQKPTIAFGRLFYGFYDQFYYCPDVRDFPHVLRDALRNFRPDTDLLLKFITALLETAYPGTISDPLRQAV